MKELTGGMVWQSFREINGKREGDVVSVLLQNQFMLPLSLTTVSDY